MLPNMACLSVAQWCWVSQYAVGLRYRAASDIGTVGSKVTDSRFLQDTCGNYLMCCMSGTGRVGSLGYLMILVHLKGW